MQAPGPGPTHEGQLRRLSADLSAAGYTVDALADLLGPMAHAALARGQRVPADLVTRSDSSPAAVLLRLWVLGTPVQTASVQAALPTVSVDGIVDMGLARLVEAGTHVAGSVDLRPYADRDHDWWVVSDLTSMATTRPVDEAHVTGVGGASVTLASWAPRPWAARALDLGTGSGVQALHLASHSAYRVVTDVSVRALQFASVTAALNGVEVEPRAGPAFEPVAGEQFDLIVCNPPFVITPRTREVATLGYRDAGAIGDGFLGELIGGVQEHLAPGGIAVFLGNWEVPAGQRWTERLDAWLDRTGLDALVVQRDEQEPSEYAETWAGDAGLRTGDDRYDGAYEEWLTDFASRRVDRIGFGIVVVQRPAEDRTTWRHFADLRGAVEHPLGPHVLAHMRARTWLVMHTDEEVLSVPWTMADDVTQEQIASPGAADPTAIRLRQAGGLGYVAEVGTVTAAVFGACDGELSARQITVAVAALLDVDLDESLAQAVSAVRELVAFGLLR